MTALALVVFLPSTTTIALADEPLVSKVDDMYEARPTRFVERTMEEVEKL